MKKEFERLKPNALIEDLNVSKRNRQFIEKHLKDMNNQVVPQRIQKIKYSLYRFADLVEKDFDKLTKEDCRTASGVICNSKTLRAKRDIIVDLRTAFKRMFGEDGEELPDFAKSLKLTKMAQTKGVLKLPKKVLSEEQTYAMIKASKSSRDKFLISFMGLDGAVRPCEVYNLKWKQIEQDKYGHYAVIETAKKSGDKETRVVRIIKSAPYFAKWCNDYPKEKKPEDNVFLDLIYHKPMKDGNLRALLRRLKKKLGFDFRIYPYLFRHSILTRMSKDARIPISLLKKFAGHSLKSNIIGEYQHFGDDDLRDMQLEINGLNY